MPNKARVVFKGSDGSSVVTENGEKLTPPSNWALLPPGDGPLTRAVKKAGPNWQIRFKKGRKVFSGGVWAPCENIDKAKKELETKRASSEYAKKRAYNLKYREKIEADYANLFYKKTLDYLGFHPNHEMLAKKIAKAVTKHAIPVGSKTVARTKRISVENRVKAAVIAWMRHNTTAYDHMKIKRVKGERRKVRRTLAAISEALLDRYRKGDISGMEQCPLQNAINSEKR